MNSFRRAYLVTQDDAEIEMKSPYGARGGTVFDKCNLFELRLAETTAHGGHGLIRFKRILSQEAISGACNFMDFTRMPPGTSVGRHSHSASQEEFYLILKGTGLLRRDGQEFRVQAGDLVRNAPGSSHALGNIGPDELWMFVFELKVLGDDPDEIERQ